MTQAQVSTEWKEWAQGRIEKHNEILIEGNGVPPMTVRVDRLEQWMKYSRANLFLLISAIVTVSVDIIIRAHK
jgi:hypothetical protein